MVDVVRNTSLSPTVSIMFLTGNMHSGKDTFADFLLTATDNSVKIGMSDAIISVASYLYNLYDPSAWTDQEQRKVPRKELGGKTTRDILRCVGDSLREKDPYVWTRLMVRTLYELTRTGDKKLIVVTGIRLISEAFVARSIGSLVGLSRKSLTVDDTPTEREVSFILENLCRSVVKNDGTLSDLKIEALRELAYCPKLTPRSTLELQTLESTNFLSLKSSIDLHQLSFKEKSCLTC